MPPAAPAAFNVAIICDVLAEATPGIPKLETSADESEGVEVAMLVAERTPVAAEVAVTEVEAMPPTLWGELMPMS